MSKIAVIGGGISGLAAAHYLKNQNHEVSLFEASDRLGGAIRTIRYESQIMEAGPDSFLVGKPAAIELAKELEIDLVPSCAVGPPSVVKNGRLLPLPEGFRLLAPTRLIPFALSRLVSLKGKIRAAAELIISKRNQESDESVADFVTRRFGREILEALAQPLIGGIYSADPAQLSLQATFPFLSRMEKSHGSVTKGMLKSLSGQSRGKPRSMFCAPRSGMGALVERLQKSIGSSSIHLSSPICAIRRQNGQWILEREGSEQSYDGIILACPAYRAAQLLTSLDGELAQGLHSVPYTTTAVCHILVRENQITLPLEGSGFVVPHVEGLDITACTYAHRKYPGRAGHHSGLLRVHLGGKLNQEVLDQSDEQLQTTALESLRPLIGLKGPIQRSWLVRHQRVVPQYAVGHMLLRERLEERLQGLHGLALAGNGLHGVGLADCVLRAKNAARNVHRQVS